jgi:hypothetical protein
MTPLCHNDQFGSLVNKVKPKVNKILQWAAPVTVLDSHLHGFGIHPGGQEVL